MKKFNFLSFCVGAALALYTSVAAAQSSSVQQSGTVTPGHGSAWVTSGVLGDAGTSTNPNINTLGIYGTGSPFCLSNTKVRTGQWYNLCFGYSTDLSAANIILTANGGASAIPLNIVAAGTTFPIGPGGLSTLMDNQFSSTQGSILYRGASAWAALAPAGSGFLSTNGTGANPSWAAGTSLSSIAANSVLGNTTSGTATPNAVSMPSCSATNSLLLYTTNSGFSCSSVSVAIVCYGVTLSTSGTCTTTGQTPGITDGSAAASGKVGQTLDTKVSSPVSLVDSTPKTIASVSVPAGQFEITGTISFFGGSSTTVTALIAGLSTTTNAFSLTAPDMGLNGQAAYSGTPFNTNSINLPVGPISVNYSSPTTIYLVGQCGFAVSTCTATGVIHYIRVR